MITDNFALAVHPRLVDGMDPVSRATFSFYTQGKRFTVRTGLDSARAEFASEADAWRHLQDHCPGGLHAMLTSPFLEERGLGRRAELFLGWGDAEVQRRVGQLHETVLDLHAQLLHALGASPAIRGKLKVTYPQRGKNISWLEVKSTVMLPVCSDFLEMPVRFLPSPVEDNTWGIRLVMQLRSDERMLWLHQRFDELVAHLATQNIKIKDVLNGVDFQF